MSKNKKLKFLVIHCSATREGQWFDSKDILSWHCAPKPKGRGWRKPGYTDIILLDGRIENLSPFDQDDEVGGFEVTNGVRGINSISRHVCYIGGMDTENIDAKDTRTAKQLATLEAYVRIMVARHSFVLIAGHNQFSSKECPSFDVPRWCLSIGIDPVNIYGVERS